MKHSLARSLAHSLSLTLSLTVAEVEALRNAWAQLQQKAESMQQSLKAAYSEVRE